MPSVWGRYSIFLAANRPASLPRMLLIKATAISIPAATPDELQRSPSSTHRAAFTHVTSFPNEVAQSKANLLLVARFPSRSPAAASSAEPVQTDATNRARDPRLLSQSKNSASSTSVLLPAPPGTRRISTVSRSAAQRVAITCAPWALVIGPAMLATYSTSISGTWPKRPTGPNTSKSSNPGNSTTVTRRCASEIVIRQFILRLYIKMVWFQSFLEPDHFIPINR